MCFEVYNTDVKPRLARRAPTTATFWDLRGVHLIQRAFQFLKLAVFLWVLEQLYLKIAPRWSEEMIIKFIQIYREYE